MSPTRRKELEGEPTTCPWCSGSVPAGAASCPSCGAALQDSVDGEVLGVTQIDPGAVGRSSRAKPGRLATWLGAEAPDEPSLGGRIEPPSKEVREEMLRLEIAAIDAELESRATLADVERQIADEDARGGIGAPGAAPAPEVPDAEAAPGTQAPGDQAPGAQDTGETEPS